MYNVLLVDDEAYALELLRDTFDWKSLGLVVKDTALNGYQGYNKFILGSYDIVIADIKMPVMMGIEMAQKIREMDSRVEIIFLTSYEEFEYAKRAIDVDAVGYCLKPLNDRELTRALKKAVASLNKAPEPKVEDDGGSLLIRQIKNHIELHIGGKIKLKDVAEQFMYSPNYIGMIFKKETQMSFNEYVNCLRLNKAASLLKISQNQIGDVAYQLGYTDVAYFTKQFKRHFKVTPLAYRNQFMHGANPKE